MKRLPLCTALLGALGASAETPLKQTYADAFGVGVAVQAAQLDRAAESELIARHFGMVVSEYQMKANVLAPREGEYDWSAADAIVACRLWPIRQSPSSYPSRRICTAPYSTRPGTGPVSAPC